MPPQFQRRCLYRHGCWWLIALTSHALLLLLWGNWQQRLLLTQKSQQVPPHTLLTVVPTPKIKSKRPRPPSLPQAPLPSGTVVDLPTAPNTPAPEQAQFLAEHNARTEHEEKSRHRSAKFQQRAHRPVTTAPKPQQQPTVPPSAVRTPQLQKAPTSTAPVAPSTPRHGLLSREQLMLSPTSLAQLTDAGPAPDALVGVDEGESTFLNAKAFKYASFFNRLKQAVAANWHPQEAGSRRDPGGGLRGNQTRITVLLVRLDRSGSLLHTQVQTSSGLSYLDEEAQQAFARAAPFNHPPQGLLNLEAQEIIFRFGFYLEPARFF